MLTAAAMLGLRRTPFTPLTCGLLFFLPGQAFGLCCGNRAGAAMEPSSSQEGATWLPVP